MHAFQFFIRSQIRLCRWLDSFLPARLRTDGNRHFLDSVFPKYLSSDIVLVDVGGGKQPLLQPQQKSAARIRVVGFDIDAVELGRAPAGAYDEIIVADITKYSGNVQADLVVCQALLEHVRDVPAAFQSLATMLGPSGKLLVFVPSRNALFARLNLLLPQRLKEALLFTIFPQARVAQGFPSFYHCCTPIDFRRLATVNGLVVREAHHYYMSGYFTFFAPLHLLWRIYSWAGRTLFSTQAAETFTMVFEKAGHPSVVGDVPEPPLVS